MMKDEDDDSGVDNPVDEDEDPMARTKRALREAKIARGVDPDEEEDVDDVPTEGATGDPMARAAAALARAAAARDEAEKGGPAAAAKEARARDELSKLKQRGGVKEPVDPGDADGDAGATPTGPKPRRL